ncbi:MAG: hypothetical protein KF729_00090 [Sandaracinaceae bacterium]|nr:hypothetical protein [Sandaracinaceae bacterium]
MRRALWLLLILPACGTPCPRDPLAPVADPAWVVRMHEPPDLSLPVGMPGGETFTDPPGMQTYAAFALYDGAGLLANERWLDTYTTLPRVPGTVNAACSIPSRLAPGVLTVLLADGTRPAVSLDAASGARAGELVTYASPPEVAGQLVDLAALGDGRALVSRRRAPGGVGGDVLLVDDGERGVLFTYALGALSTGAVEPGAIALVEEGGAPTRAVVGLALPGEPASGAVAVIDTTTGEARRLDLPGLERCGAVVALAPSADGVARVAVLCVGDLTREPAERAGVGLALLEAPPGLPVTVASTRLASSLFSGRVPSRALVALAGAWVAVLAEGDPDGSRPDAVIAVHLGSDAATLLLEAPWTEAFGASLGQGDFRGTELWWPDARGAVHRFAMQGEDERATFELLAGAPLPGCSRLPPREVRAIPPR